MSDLGEMVGYAVAVKFFRVVFAAVVFGAITGVLIYRLVVS